MRGVNMQDVAASSGEVLTDLDGRQTMWFCPVANALESEGSRAHVHLISNDPYLIFRNYCYGFVFY